MSAAPLPLPRDLSRRTFLQAGLAAGAAAAGAA